MKRLEDGNYVLTDEEVYSLVRAFANFNDILVLDSDDEDCYFTNGNLSCLSSSCYETCSRLHDGYFNVNV